MIAIISALDPNRVIGKRNALPWYISEDLKNFKRLTSGNTVVMGKNTYDSIGRPLPKRNNIVLNQEMTDIPGVDVCLSIPEALDKAKAYGKDIYIIGGASVYEQTLDLVDSMYLSHIKREYEGDVFFPEFNEQDWHKSEEKDYDEFILVTYNRK